MPALGTKQRPAIVRVHDHARAQEILDHCESMGWVAIAGVEPDKPEDVSDYERLLNPPLPVRAEPKVERNAPCPCGSGKKFNRCCGVA